MTEFGTVPSADEIADRLAISDVLIYHSRGVDRADEAILKAAYWPNAEVEYGRYNGPAHPFCELLPAAIKRNTATQHRVTNIAIEFRDDLALVESYVTAYHYRSVEDGPDTEVTYLARYVDRMQKRGNSWKILHRQVVADWDQNVEATADLSAPPRDGFARGGRAPDDPVYRLLAP